MVKVLKRSSLEIAADVEEFFDGETIEEATKKAHYQIMPGELAKINITDNKFIKATIKVVGEEHDNESKQYDKIVPEAEQHS
tara:strand:- start:111 stop:356 length:246 start_codon:yes stop_codon:yes gene_type:complete